ncbi:Class A beta-lactamase-related serine hydrolase OS=Streptomyces alboniger OX=132473 GN=CP975_17510 PE=4 SV=1 [Streptomyces alboniger]
MTTPQEELLPGTRRALLHRIAVAQAEGRAPSLVAAVVRDGRVVWHGSRTSVDGHGPDENVQYRIGSITKTFTAVLVLRLRDEGVLDLNDRLEKHLPGTGAGEATVADLLAHTGGLAAESPAPWWERTRGSLRPELADVLGEQPYRHPIGRRFHYSNPGYTLLGALVERLRGAPWEEVLRREVLEPLGLHRTSAQPRAPHAGGWAVHPWADAMLPEPAEDLGRMASAGQLWSTAGDLARFAVFLTNGDDRVLGARSVQEMR